MREMSWSTSMSEEEQEEMIEDVLDGYLTPHTYEPITCLEDMKELFDIGAYKMTGYTDDPEKMERIMEAYRRWEEEEDEEPPAEEFPDDMEE